MLIECFFFFKRKTAYEMRISDWSSDVCSSDLDDRNHPCPDDDPAGAGAVLRRADAGQEHALDDDAGRRGGVPRDADLGDVGLYDGVRPRFSRRRRQRLRRGVGQGVSERSEEHTSELQSLMRISYAVFCLKTKKIN